MWQDGPRDLKVTSAGRAKLFMPSRGICMTPAIRPSAAKPTSVPKVDEPPLAIVRTVANRQEIVAVSPAALNLAIRSGLTLTEGRALCGGLVAFGHDPLRDARALEALARWMTRFTPFVSLSGHFSSVETTPASRSTPSGEEFAAALRRDAGVAPTKEPPYDGDAIYLDITGCERVFGGISNIVHNVIGALSRLRLSAGVAVAPTPGAAWAFASFGQNGKIVPRENLAHELSELPVVGLRLDEELRQSLHHLGIESIGQVMNLPRSALPSRFGPTLLTRLDQALGRIDEPLVPLPWHAPLEARMDFDGAVDSIETIYLVFKRLIGQIVSELTRRGCAARRIEVEFFRAYAQTISHTIALSRPSRDPVNLFNLVRCATENLQGGDDGFLGIRLFVPIAERIGDEQIALLDQERYAGEIELAQLIERLCVRLGEDAIGQPQLLESHVPERAFRSGFGARVSGIGSNQDAFALTRYPNPETRNPSSRPLQLLPDPTEIAVMVSPSDDRDGRPILFRRGGEVHELRHAVGPERISGEWWRGHDKTRDYFDVEDHQGRRFWVFRVNETGKWYVHGCFM